jgi:hypothetical protein
MAKKYIIKKAQVGVKNPLQTSTSKFQEVLKEKLPVRQGLETNSLKPTSMTTSFETNTGYDFSPEFKLFNLLAQLSTGALNKVQDVRNTKDEYKQYLQSLQPVGYESTTEQGLNDLPMYAQAGGKIKSVKGVGKNDNPIVEAEEGEVFTTQDGQIQKVAEGAGTHEEGGVLLNDVERVLEDTSDKRKDKVSQALKVSPIMAKLLADVDTKSPLSHSKVMEKARENQSKQLTKIQKNLQKNVDSITSVPTNKYAQNSMDMNLMNLNTLSSEQEIFDKIFDHQEFVKAALGIQVPQAKCGGKYKAKKAQVGIDRRPDGSLLGTETPQGMGTDRKPKGNANFMPVYNPNDGKWYLKPRVPVSDEPTGRLANPKTLQTANTYPNKRSTNIDLSSFIGDRIKEQDLIDGVNRPFDEFGISSANQSSVNADNMDISTSLHGQSSGNSIGTSTGSKGQGNRFNEPLQWFDVAGPISGLLEGRIPAKYNPAQLNQIRLKQQNPLPALQNAQSDFNAILSSVSQNNVGLSNMANIFSKKYGLDNQILGQYENINSGIKNQELQYNAGIADRQSQLDQASREVFERKYLGSKEAQRQQQKQSLDEIYQRLALNRKVNREGNLLMQLFPALDQYGQYNGYKYNFRAPLNTPKPKK